MSLPPEAVQAGVGLADVAVRNTAAVVADRVRKAKASHDQADEINQLTDIINDLLADKSELVAIGRRMDEQLISQNIDASDLTFITETLIPAIEAILRASSEDEQGDESNWMESLDTVKKLATPEMLSVLQLVGFNFREAIGAPLTELVAGAIRAQVSGAGVDPNVIVELELRRQVLALEAAKDNATTTRAKGLLEPPGSAPQQSVRRKR